MDTNPKTSIGQNVHKSGVPRFPSFDLSLLYSVGLQKFVQPLLRAPSTFVRVRIYLAGGGIAHDWILPIGELYDPACFLRDEQLGRPKEWGRQFQTRASRLNRQRVSYLGTNSHDM